MKLSQGKFKSARNDYVISMDTGWASNAHFVSHLASSQHGQQCIFILSPCISAGRRLENSEADIICVLN